MAWSHFLHCKGEKKSERKVLGASSKGILFLFSKEFARLTFIAFLIAAPIAYYAMNMWLQTFANRIRLQPGFFITGLMISLAITLITIGYQSAKASLVNPAESLRTE